MKFSTKAIHCGEEPNLKEGGYGDIVTPIHLASTFARTEINKPTGGYEYARTGNPTRKALEKRLAELENAKYGLAFASGLAAETTLLLALSKTGDHIIAFEDLYGGTRRLFDKTLTNYGLEFTYVDATRKENVEAAITKKSKLIWLETPTNPLLKLCDIEGISRIAEKYNLLTVVDNTFATPYLQNPLDLGADIVVHSTTKYLGGHSDVVGGAILISNDELYSRLKFNQNAIGAVPSPFDCYLVLRGTKTLALRMDRHNYNALKLAEYLTSHSLVEKVNYPGLKSHPQHELAKKQMNGFGGIISFYLKQNVNIKNFLSNLKIIALAESLGAVESLINQPASMTHASLTRRERDRIGITDNLLRLSVGIEDVEDLKTDLDQAFQQSLGENNA
ncbi:MAG TPA: PLP-dependent aspartate aminotransferase family protein [Candidatus Sulfotelmatobacter sp.]|nr:PLP-dependent aspartate aminotransferase family protein [Candidatus Sulfotelmatobacter sp.]